MQKMRGFFTQDSRRRESKSTVFSPTENVKRQDNPKAGSPKRSRTKKGRNEEKNETKNETKKGENEAKRRWKLVRNICFAFRIGPRCSSKVLLKNVPSTKYYSLGSKI